MRGTKSGAFVQLWAHNPVSLPKNPVRPAGFLSESEEELSMALGKEVTVHAEVSG